MSFSSTPLGQARRLDRDTFLGKQNLNGNRPPSPHRIIPTSYSLGAHGLGPRSNSKQASPTGEHNPDDDTNNEPALARFARQKQREAAGASRPGAPRTITSPPNPTRWNVKDTTVNIASAFAQAANSSTEMAPAFNPNNSWASSSRVPTHVPRSTSVEYEAQASATQGRRLAPPNRFPGRGTAGVAKPPSKTRSLQHVPDSEGEEQGPGGRAKSPFEKIVDAARQALDPAVFYVRQRPDDSLVEPHSVEQQQPSVNGSHAGNDSSYNYEEEERFVQREQEKDRTQRNERAKAKRGRISVDNQAWKPSRFDEEEDESEDEGPEKRRKGKKNLSVGRLTNLPTVVDGKTSKKRRPKGSRGNMGGPDDDEGGSDDNTDISTSITATQRASVPPPRISVDPPEKSGEFSMDLSEQGLQSIPEVPEEDIARSSKAAADEKPRPLRTRRGSRATTPSPRPPRFSIGALLGTLIRYVVTAITGVFVFLIKLLASCLFLLGRVLGTTYDVLVNRPYQWASNTRPGFAVSIGKYILLGVTILSAWYALQNPAITSRLPSFPISHSRPEPVYTAPGGPVANIDELVKRLTRIEAALSDLSNDNARIKVKTEDSSKSYGDVLQRLGSVEGRITTEARRISDHESRERESIGRTISTVKQEVEVLHAQLEAQQRQLEKEKLNQRPPQPDIVSDEEARARLKALEERVGTVEGGVKDALDLSKKIASTPPLSPVPAPAEPVNQGAAWWSKIISKTGTKEGMRITTPDGQDVTGLISHLVDSAVGTMKKDGGIAKADFALYYAGGRIIPSLTSPTFEIKPSSIASTVWGAFTGNGHAVGHPPVTAIEPSLDSGRCWPITGSQGQLGVALAIPAYVDEITIDHVAREIAFDMRTAPREMEVWALVEGQDNIAKLRAHREHKVTLRKQALEEAGEELDADWEEKELKSEIAREKEGYPATLPKHPEYIRIAKLTYDIHASKNIQTFQVDPEVKEMGMDFGVLVARVLNNWGHDSYTCLYRFRVHGQRLGELPPPYSEVQEEAEASMEA